MDGIVKRIKSWHVIVGAAVCVLGAGAHLERNVAAPQRAAAQQIATDSARIRRLEVWRDSTVDPALQFLVCSQRAQNRGRDPRMCEDALLGVRAFLENPFREPVRQ